MDNFKNINFILNTLYPNLATSSLLDCYFKYTTNLKEKNKRTQRTLAIKDSFHRLFGRLPPFLGRKCFQRPPHSHNYNDFQPRFFFYQFGDIKKLMKFSKNYQNYLN